MLMLIYANTVSIKKLIRTDIWQSYKAGVLFSFNTIGRVPIFAKDWAKLNIKVLLIRKYMNEDKD